VSDRVWLLRHGATEWTEAERHTGREEVPLSNEGRDQAREAGGRLAGIEFANVFVSPQGRARETAALAGVGERAQVRDELVEWDYGDYEGLSDEETEKRQPGWDLFRDGCPGGESPQQVKERVDRFLGELSGYDGTCLLVAHGKLLRALAARWLDQGVALGSALAMDPAAISLLAREGQQPLLRLWNFTGRLEAVS
jgi:broad specificity phosphatase PhoE